MQQLEMVASFIYGNYTENVNICWCKLMVMHCQIIADVVLSYWKCIVKLLLM